MNKRAESIKPACNEEESQWKMLKINGWKCKSVLKEYVCCMKWSQIKAKS